MVASADPSIPSPPDTTPPTARLAPPVTGANAALRIPAAADTPLITFDVVFSLDVLCESDIESVSDSVIVSVVVVVLESLVLSFLPVDEFCA